MKKLPALLEQGLWGDSCLLPPRKESDLEVTVLTMVKVRQPRLQQELSVLGFQNAAIKLGTRLALGADFYVDLLADLKNLVRRSTFTSVREFSLEKRTNPSWKNSMN